MTEQATSPAPSDVRTVLFQVVDRHGASIAGARVECFINGQKNSTQRSGKRPSKIDVSPANARVRFVAHYRDFPEREGTPDSNGICRIVFPQVAPTPPMTPPALPTHQTALNLIIIFVFVLGLGFIGAGAWIAFLRDTAETSVDILGMTINTKSAGVASIFIGGVVIITIFRKALKTIVELTTARR